MDELVLVLKAALAVQLWAEQELPLSAFVIA
jgi:hypothetical protein